MVSLIRAFILIHSKTKIFLSHLTICQHCIGVNTHYQGCVVAGVKVGGARQPKLVGSGARAAEVTGGALRAVGTGILVTTVVP
jgi:hypothetical protein